MIQRVNHAVPAHRAIEAIVAAGGSEPREAKLVAENLVTRQPDRPRLARHRHDAALRRCAASRAGSSPTAHPVVKFDGGALVALDGQAGLRPGDRPGGDRHRDRARQAARRVRHGARPTRTICAASATGPSRRWPQGLVSIHFVNVISRAIVAPFGGSDARFGTNPFTVGIPLARRAAVHPRHGDQRAWRRARCASRTTSASRSRRTGCSTTRATRPRSALRRQSSLSARCAPSACTRATASRWSASCWAARSPAAARGIPTTAPRSASGTAC